MAMLESLKRLFSRPGIERDLSEIEELATRRGHGFKRVRHEDGFVLDGLPEGQPWRSEWGPPPRTTIAGPELRLPLCWPSSATSNPALSPAGSWQG